MQRFLIPELLHLVFSMTNKATLLDVILVSKTWCDIGLDSLWENMDELFPLLATLAPLIDQDDLWVVRSQPIVLSKSEKTYLLHWIDKGL